MKLFKIETGFFLSDGGACFGSVPKLAWADAYPADEDNFCKWSMRSLLVQAGDRLILIDTGVGTKHWDIMEEYGFREMVTLESQLAKHGFSCQDVTDVVLTHLHFEHCGGCTWIDQDFKLQLTFPNATHWVSEEQWKTLLAPNIAEENSMLSVDVMEIFNQDKFKFINEDTQLCEGVDLRLFSGHSANQIVVYLKDANQTYIFAGDVIPTAAHLPLRWLSAIDVDQVAALTGKNQILEKAVNEHQAIIFAHDYYTPCVTVRKVDDFEKDKEVNF
ncbi:MAG: MBL fold metallo-hydrolase [Paludibacteraceae bacterium]|nr:MBL fold metallo-hydrolase [Paludibacteraceae bacterium]